MKIVLLVAGAIRSSYPYKTIYASAIQLQRIEGERGRVSLPLTPCLSERGQRERETKLMAGVGRRGRLMAVHVPLR